MDVLGHLISEDGVRSDDDRVAALSRIPILFAINQLRSLLDGLSYNRKFLSNTAMLPFDFTSLKEDTVHTLLAELAISLVLVFPNWDLIGRQHETL